MLILRQLDEMGTQQRPAAQIEGARRLFLDYLLRALFPLALIHEAQVYERWFDRLRGVDVLGGLSAQRREGRPQRLVPPHDLRQSLFQRRHVKSPRQPDDVRHVIERAARLETVDKPEPLLRE